MIFIKKIIFLYKSKAIFPIFRIFIKKKLTNFFIKKKIKNQKRKHQIFLQTKNITHDFFSSHSYNFNQVLKKFNYFSYLEIGSFEGNSALYVAHNFQNSEIHCVDNWTQSNIQPAENDIVLPENTKEEFIKNTYDNKNIIIHDNDIFEVDKTHISDVDLFFYDALKDEETISKTIEYFYECFSDTCILIFDDANWDGIILGTNEGIEKMNATVLYRKLIKNKIEDSSQWWNGLYIVVIKK